MFKFILPFHLKKSRILELGKDLVGDMCFHSFQSPPLVIGFHHLVIFLSFPHKKGRKFLKMFFFYLVLLWLKVSIKSTQESGLLNMNLSWISSTRWISHLFCILWIWCGRFFFFLSRLLNSWSLLCVGEIHWKFHPSFCILSLFSQVQITKLTLLLKMWLGIFQFLLFLTPFPRF